MGFLGPNGAGKSTTMKVLAGYIPPSEGQVQVGGFDVMEKPGEVKKMIGYLPENNPLYLDMFVHEYLQFVGSLHRIRGSKLRKRVHKVIELCGISSEQNKVIGALSKGFRQRVGLAQSLIHDPSVLILDEPTTGLDPNQIVEIRELIRRLSQEKTVLFSTHILQEVKQLCNRAVIINQGKIVADSPVDQLGKTIGQVKILEVEFTEDVNQEDLQEIEGVLEVERIGKAKFSLKTDPEKEIRANIFEFAKLRDKTLIELKQGEELETIFWKLTNQ